MTPIGPHQEPTPPSNATTPPPVGSQEWEVQLVTEHLPLVHHLVRETLSRVPSHVTGDDLTSAGMVALVQAARAFQTDRGVKFSTFASARIRGAILDELRALDWASRSVRRRARQIDTATEAVSGEKGGTATDEEVAQATGLSLREIDKNRAAVARASVLSMQGFGESGPDEFLPTREPSPEEVLERREEMAFLCDAIQLLPSRLRKVIEDYFFEERPMAVIAAELGVTESRVSQMRAEALVRLRGALGHVLGSPATKPSGRAGRHLGVAERRRQDYYEAVAVRRTPAARLTTVS